MRFAVDNQRPPPSPCVTLSLGVIASMEQHGPTRVDMTLRYTLADGARVFARSADSVQIGTDEPRCVLVRDAPTETAGVLAGLDGAATLAQVLLAHDADPLLWSGLIEQLLATDLLVAVEQPGRGHVPAVPAAHLTDERAGLLHRYGASAASRIMQARDDALVVVRGRSPLAAQVATLLAASGVGHIHHEPGRSVDWSAPDQHRASVTTTRGPQDRIAADLLRASPSVRMHPPAAHQRPTIVLVTGEPLPDLGVAASLVRSRVPHLAATVGVSRGVVGPLVLPGRSSCLSCAERRRTDADPEWPAVAGHLADSRIGGSAFLTCIAACLAAGQLLEFIDGEVTPATVNGTVEWLAGTAEPRRRTWDVHPDCGCRSPVASR